MKSSEHEKQKDHAGRRKQKVHEKQPLDCTCIVKMARYCWAKVGVKVKVIGA